MNCAEYHDWVQGHLDGDGVEESAGAAHRAGCPTCAGMHEALGRFEMGLRLYVPPPVPERLAESITYQVMAEQRQARRWRGMAMVAAVAAALLVALYVGNRRPEAPPLPDQPTPMVQITPDPIAAPRLNEQVGEASNAIASLVSRKADAAVGQGKLLLPEAVVAPVPGVDALQHSLEPPAQSLYEASQGVSSGLEPVTSSARRAVSLFMRDLPPMGSGMQ